MTLPALERRVVDEMLLRRRRSILSPMTEPEIVVFVEIPAGSRNKYEFDPELGGIVLDRRLFTSMTYPADYGYIEGTLGEDGDPLDALVLVGDPTFPGCRIRVRPIGVFYMTDEKGSDEKILCASLRDPAWSRVHDIHDLQPGFATRSSTSSRSTRLEKKKTSTRGFGNRAEAMTTISGSAHPARRNPARRLATVPAFDVHQHLWPETFTAALARRREPPCLGGRVLRLPGELDSEIDLGDYDLDTRLALLDRHGIDVALVSVPPGYLTDPERKLADAYHTGVLEPSDRRPAGSRRSPPESVDPGSPAPASQPGSLVGGIDPLLRELREARQLLFVHPGPPRGSRTTRRLVGRGRRLQRADAGRLCHVARARRHSVRRPARDLRDPRRRSPIQLERMRSRVDDRSAMRERLLRHVVVRAARARPLPRHLRGHPARPRKRRPGDRSGTHARRDPGLRRCRGAMILHENPRRLLEGRSAV